MGSTATDSRRSSPPRARSVDEAARERDVRLALSKPDAAAALDISVNSFERHVQPELRVVRRGKLRLFPVAELERWLRENSERVFEDADERR